MTCGVNETSTELGCIPNTVPGFVGRFYSIGLGLIGGVAIIFIIYGGYILMTSQGRPDRISNGKSYITYAIIGLLLAIFGYILIQVVAINILHIPGFS
jgi:glucose uptake protein GlcU